MIEVNDKVQIVEREADGFLKQYIGKTGTVVKVYKNYCWVAFSIGRKKWDTQGSRYTFYPSDDPIKVKVRYNEIIKVKK